MKLKLIVLGIAVLLLTAVLIFFLWNKYAGKSRGPAGEVTRGVSEFPQGCGPQNCHGIDISCGPDIVRECDQDYSPGDVCRRFQNCVAVDGSCQIVKEPTAFDDCQICTEKCQNQNQGDLQKITACEKACIAGGDDLDPVSY